jgi:hypothetical protein
MGAGLVFYAIYGFWNSKLRNAPDANIAFVRPKKELSLIINYEASEDKNV